MIIKELIAALQEYDENSEVHIAYNYGDHWRTRVAPKVERVDEEEVKWSEYHSMDAVVSDDEAGESAEQRLVVVLS